MDMIVITEGTPILADIAGKITAAVYIRPMVRPWGFDGKLHVALVALSEDRGDLLAGQIIDIAPHQILLAA